jgi:hypothetical protein
MDALQQAYILLSAANGDADGHRDRALKEVEGAAKILEPKALQGVQQKVKARRDQNAAAVAKIKAQSKDTGYEAQALSDRQLGLASGLLQQLAVALDANKQTKALTHVKSATKQINLALKVSIQGHEAEALKEVYILLAAVNKNYSGHRAAAMKQVEEACTLLDKSILNKGTIEQRVKALQDDAVAAAAKQQVANSAGSPEYQWSSECQVYIAGLLLQQVALTLHGNKQRAVLDHVRTAIGEIEAALKTN